MSFRSEANHTPGEGEAIAMVNDVRGRFENRKDPEMRAGSEEGLIPERPNEGFPTFTLGYEGRTLAEVLRIIQVQAIHQVLDVREVASSRKPGFTSSELKEALARMGVAYVHLPELGCEKEARHTLWRGGARGDFMERYDRRISERHHAVDDLVLRVRSARSLLLCLERDPTECHRAVLGERLRAEGVAVLDL